MHKGSDQLVAELEEAAKLVEVGAIYRHYKSADKTYKVIGFTIWEATDEVAIIYEAQYGAKLSFCRALSVWLEDVEFEDQMVPRFRLV